MSMKDKTKNIKTVIIGAILTGIALVIANSWGAAIKKTVSILVNKVKCSKLLDLNIMGEDGEEDKTNKADNDEKYQKCKDKNSIYSLYINALITSILLSIIVYMMFGNSGLNTM